LQLWELQRKTRGQRASERASERTREKEKERGRKPIPEIALYDLAHFLVGRVAIFPGK
jgi:hypothetical protein